MLEQQKRRNVEIQVMPLRQEDHFGFEGPMYLAETVDTQWIGYIEGHENSLLITDSKDASAMLQRYGQDALTGSEPTGHHEPAGADARSAMSSRELHWFKSSYSGGGGDNRVEVAIRPGTVHIRDSKDPQTGQLTVSPEAWSAFIARL